MSNFTGLEPHLRHGNHASNKIVALISKEDPIALFHNVISQSRNHQRTSSGVSVVKEDISFVSKRKRKMMERTLLKSQNKNARLELEDQNCNG